MSLEIFGYHKCWHMVNCVFTPIFSKLHCKLPLCISSATVMSSFFFLLQLFSWKSVTISSSSHLSPVSISWKHQYIQSLQKNDVIIKFHCSGIFIIDLLGLSSSKTNKQTNKQNPVFFCCIVPGVVWIRNVPLCIWTLCNHLVVMFGKAMNLWHMKPCWEKHGIGAVGFCNLAQILGLSFCLFHVCRWNVTSTLPVAYVPHHGRFSSASTS